MKLICKEECAVQKKSGKGKGWTLFSSVLLLFMPKCALCWAAYMSVLSSLGIVIKYQPWFIPMAFVFFGLTLIKLLVHAMRRKNFIAFGLAIVAGLLIIYQRSAPGIDAIKILAILLMMAAVLMDKIINLYKQLQAR